MSIQLIQNPFNTQPPPFQLTNKNHQELNKIFLEALNDDFPQRPGQNNLSPTRSLCSPSEPESYASSTPPTDSESSPSPGPPCDDNDIPKSRPMNPPRPFTGQQTPIPDDLDPQVYLRLKFNRTPVGKVLLINRELTETREQISAIKKAHLKPSEELLKRKKILLYAQYKVLLFIERNFNASESEKEALISHKAPASQAERLNF